MGVRNKVADRNPEVDLREFAQLLYEIYIEQKADGKIINGQNNANKTDDD